MGHLVDEPTFTLWQWAENLLGNELFGEKFDLWIRPHLSIDGRSNCSNVVSSISTAVHMESDSNCNKRLGASAWSSECQFTACVVCNELELSPISLFSSLFPASHPSPPRAENLLGNELFGEKFDLWIRPHLSIDGRSNCSNVVSSISTAVHMESDSNCNKRLGASAWSSECQYIYILSYW